MAYARSPDRVPAAAAWAAIAALVAWSAWQRWQLLASSPFPFGVDGYFYPVQLRALLATGHLQYPSAPLALWLMAPFAAATDPIVGAKLAAAVLGALVAVPAYGVGARLGGSRGAGLIAAALATTSAGSTYMTIEFVKNGIGLTVALAAIWAGLAVDPRTRARVAIATIALVAAFATHKMAAGLAVLVLAPQSIAAAPPAWRLRIVAAIGAIVAAVLAIGALAPRRLLSPADVALVRAALTTDARWTAPALVAGPHELAFGHEALAAAVLGLLVLASLIVPREHVLAYRGPRAAAFAIALLAILTALPWLDVRDPQGLGFRLRIAAYVPLALLAAIAWRTVADAVARAWPSWLAAATAATIALAMPPPSARPDGVVTTHPALVTASLALAGRVPDGTTLVVPERHIAFMVAYYTGAPVALSPTSTPRASRLRVLPLATIGADSPLDRALVGARRDPDLAPPLGLHPGAPNGLVVVPESTWDWALTRLPDRDRRYFAAWPTR